jgi:hypothetical protein
MLVGQTGSSAVTFSFHCMFRGLKGQDLLQSRSAGILHAMFQVEGL